MNSLTDPRAIVTFILLVFGFVWAIRKQDPAELIAELVYAIRRAVWIAGQMMADIPGEYKTRWNEQRPLDAEAIKSLEAKYPAGETGD